MSSTAFVLVAFVFFGEFARPKKRADWSFPFWVFFFAFIFAALFDIGRS
jgi:hypothetical protein